LVGGGPDLRAHRAGAARRGAADGVDRSSGAAISGGAVTSTMWGRWAVAAGGALALALLTLNADISELARASAPEGSVCRPDAKPANLNFTLNDMENKPVRLADHKGKVILLDFWATWCGPCKVEIPWFQEFHDKYGKSGLQVFGVSVDDTLEKLKPYVRTMRM